MHLGGNCSDDDNVWKAFLGIAQYFSYGIHRIADKRPTADGKAEFEQMKETPFLSRRRPWAIVHQMSVEMMCVEMWVVSAYLVRNTAFSIPFGPDSKMEKSLTCLAPWKKNASSPNCQWRDSKSASSQKTTASFTLINEMYLELLSLSVNFR